MFFGFHFLNISFFFFFVNQIVVLLALVPGIDAVILSSCWPLCLPSCCFAVLLASVPAFLLFCRSAGPCACLPAVLPFCWPLCLPSCCFAVLLAPVPAFLLFCRSAG
ncbi:hypothetical protein, partial [Thiolapillus sp.]|uniref:hypothetical protein n=1 Tax=Thiolapillus sp. TaxID=2017437 RepID=UPI003AF9118D